MPTTAADATPTASRNGGRQLHELEVGPAGGASTSVMNCPANRKHQRRREDPFQRGLELRAGRQRQRQQHGNDRDAQPRERERMVVAVVDLHGGARRDSAHRTQPSGQAAVLPVVDPGDCHPRLQSRSSRLPAAPAGPRAPSR